jgi:hypothetical protein
MLRGLPHLCSLFPEPKEARRLKQDPENEPNFYAISKAYPLPDDPNYSPDEMYLQETKNITSTSECPVPYYTKEYGNTPALSSAKNAMLHFVRDEGKKRTLKSSDSKGMRRKKPLLVTSGSIPSHPILPIVRHASAPVAAKAAPMNGKVDAMKLLNLRSTNQTKTGGQLQGPDLAVAGGLAPSLQPINHIQNSNSTNVQSSVKSVNSIQGSVNSVNPTVDDLLLQAALILLNQVQRNLAKVEPHCTTVQPGLNQTQVLQNNVGASTTSMSPTERNIVLQALTSVIRLQPASNSVLGGSIASQSHDDNQQRSPQCNASLPDYRMLSSLLASPSGSEATREPAPQQQDILHQLTKMLEEQQRHKEEPKPEQPQQIQLTGIEVHGVPPQPSVQRNDILSQLTMMLQGPQMHSVESKQLQQEQSTTIVGSNIPRQPSAQPHDALSQLLNFLEEQQRLREESRREQQNQEQRQYPTTIQNQSDLQSIVAMLIGKRDQKQQTSQQFGSRWQPH